jgi:hypothetical protein
MGHILCETERMKRFQPAMVTMTTIGARTQEEFDSTRHS